MTQTTSNNEPEEVFTETFNKLVMVVDNNLPAFEEAINSLGKNELKRVALTLAEHPWKQSKKLVSQNEVLAVTLGKQIIESTAHALQEYSKSNPEIVQAMEEEIKKEYDNE
jgi:hypothetical protein